MGGVTGVLRFDPLSTKNNSWSLSNGIGVEDSGLRIGAPQGGVAQPATKYTGITMRVASIVLCSLLTACASGYSTFYQPNADAVDIMSRRAAPAPASPIVEHAAPADPEKVLEAYARRAYQLVGVSSFNSGMRETDAAAIAQAKKVGADLVLILNPQYTNTIQTTVPITTPTTTTSYTTGSATAYAYGGAPVTAYGNATTTTYGSKTSYVPMSTNRYDFTAVYFVRTKMRLGAFVRNLSDAERQTMGTNHGVVVTLVSDATPAFDSDLLAGDVLLTINGQRVSSQDAYGALLNQYAGQRVELTLSRNGTSVTKTIKLNN